MRKKVIIDCDPGIDDSLAIMLALSCDQIEVLGITIVCGNSPTEMGAGNAAKVLRQMNRLDIPIFTGERTPLKRDYVNALDTHGADGLGESFLEPVENFSFHTDAVSFLEETILKTHCSVIALGPMTNLARLIQKNPAAFAAISLPAPTIATGLSAIKTCYLLKTYALLLLRLLLCLSVSALLSLAFSLLFLHLFTFLEG